MRIKPNPRGGPGYANICLSPFPSYSHEPYDPPEKKPKGNEITLFTYKNFTKYEIF